jgi:hypothetical protein
MVDVSDGIVATYQQTLTPANSAQSQIVSRVVKFSEETVNMNQQED